MAHNTGTQLLIISTAPSSSSVRRERGDDRNPESDANSMQVQTYFETRGVPIRSIKMVNFVAYTSECRRFIARPTYLKLGSCLKAEASPYKTLLEPGTPTGIQDKQNYHTENTYTIFLLSPLFVMVFGSRRGFE